VINALRSERCIILVRIVIYKNILCENKNENACRKTHVVHSLCDETMSERNKYYSPFTCMFEEQGSIIFSFKWEPLLDEKKVNFEILIW